MKIIILAAGKGQRYRDGGFDVPKPLIRYKDRPLIEWSLMQFASQLNHVIVVGIPEVCYYVRGAHPEVRTVTVEHTQEGPAMSALLAGGFIAANESVVIVDCDVLFSQNHAATFAADLAEDALIDAGLLFTCIGGDTSAYCNVQLVDEDGSALRLGDRINALTEKTGDSEFIAVGVYGFKRWREFITLVMRRYTCTERGEVYLSAVLQEYCAMGKNVRGTVIAEEEWTPVGTPKEMQDARA
jgi:dTDP-glucose pyrophosphorylase